MNKTHHMIKHITWTRGFFSSKPTWISLNLWEVSALVFVRPTLSMRMFSPSWGAQLHPVVLHFRQGCSTVCSSQSDTLPLQVYWIYSIRYITFCWKMFPVLWYDNYRLLSVNQKKKLKKPQKTQTVETICSTKTVWMCLREA